jgi:phage gpG-like protein
MTFDIRIDSAHAEAVLGAAIDKIVQPVPLMRAVATELATVTAFNFLSQGRPRWLGLQRPSPKRANGMILQSSGRLRDSIVESVTGTSAAIGTNVVYAAIHQLGGQTRPHVILPKNKKALAFNGRVVKKVNHPGSKIPARPFLPIDHNGNLQPEAVSGIESAVQEYLQSVFDR